MAKTTLNKKTSEFEVSVVAKKENWKKAQENMYKKLVKDLDIKGFRKGHVPENMAKKHISDAQVMSNALPTMLDELVKEAAAELTKDIMVLDSPTYKVEKISTTELEVKFLYPVYPDIKLPDYKKLGVKYEAPKSDKTKVKKEIERVQKMQASLEAKDGAIEKGDTAIFDFKGTVDGVAFDGGTAEKFSLEIGSGQFIPGFEDQMIGLKVGDEKDIKVTFPEEYQSEDLKGKDAVFAVKIHEVKIKKLPEINDEFVKSIGVEGVKTISELEAYLEELFKNQDEQQARQKFQKEAFDVILKDLDVVIPAQLIGKEMNNQERQFEEQMKQQGLSMQQYIEMTGMKPEALATQFKSAAESRLKESIIFAEIAKLEKIELKDEDYEKEYKKLAKVYGQSEDAIKGTISKPQMQIPMTNDRVIDILIKENK